VISKLKIHYLIAFAILVTFTLSCGLLTQVENLKSTAEVMGTTVQGGKEIVETGQALITQVDGSELVETAQGMATQIGDSGLQDTAQALVTQVSGSNIPATAKAVVTQIITSPEDIPDEIPVMEGEKSAFVGSQTAISYFIKAEFDQVLDFYQREMPARGWKQIDFGTTTTDSSAELHYEKANKKATVVITTVPFVEQVTIVITIE